MSPDEPQRDEPMTPDGDRAITVSRDLLRAELGALELRIVDRLTTEIAKKADQEDVRSIRHRVQTLEAQRPLGDRIVTEFLELKAAVDDLRMHGSPEVRAAQTDIDAIDNRVRKLELWRSFLAGAVTVALFLSGFASDIVIRHYF